MNEFFSCIFCIHSLITCDKYCSNHSIPDDVCLVCGRDYSSFDDIFVENFKKNAKKKQEYRHYAIIDTLKICKNDVDFF